MHAPIKSCVAFLVAGLMIVILGCKTETATEKPKLPTRPKATKKSPEPPSEDPAAKTPPAPREEQGQPKPKAGEGTSEAKTEAPPAAPEKQTEAPPAALGAVPKVHLSQADEAASLVKVGDKLPDAELPDLTGKSQPVHSLYGPKLTVVVFWSPGSLTGVQELQDLGHDVMEPYGEEGASVIGIAVGGSPEEIKTKAELAGVKFPILMDGDGALLAKVTSDKQTLPRTYLLDGAGRILWFDVTYSSRGTREELLQAVRAVLGK
jgi:peroxiredoxin